MRLFPIGVAGALVALSLAAVPADAQTVRVKVVAACGAENYPTNLPNVLEIDQTGKLCVAASVSASITGFAPAATGTPISVTTSGVTGTLPAGTVVAAFNTGATNTAFCKLGASSTTSDIAIPPASWFAFTVGGATQLTCITSTSTTTVNMVGGSGLPTGAGGGGGGSGGAVTNAGTFPVQLTGATNNINNIAGTVSLPTGAATAANQATEISSLASLVTNTGTYLGAVSKINSSAAEANHVIKASAGDLISLSGSAASGSYIMLVDAASAPTAGGAAIAPVKCWGPMAAAGPFAFGWGAGPVLHFSTGIVVVSSSTGCFTNTAVNAAFFSAEFN